MAWRRELADLITGLENTQFPFASIRDDLAALSKGVAEIEGESNEPVRLYLGRHIAVLIAKHQRCMGAFAIFHALLTQQARKEGGKPR